MPFKTRQQKIAAASRHFTLGDSKIKLPTQEIQRAIPAIKKASTFSQNIQDLSYVKRELIKIFLTAIAIVAIQIGFVVILQV